MNELPHRTSLLVLTVALLLCGGCSKQSDQTSETTVTPTPAVEEISVRFPIPVVESGQASFYLAEDRGYYTREGLKVRWQMGSKELNPVKMVVSGADTFGIIGGPDTLVVARANGQPVKAVAVLHRHSNFPCLVTLESSGITRPQQLDKRPVGFYYGHISTDVLRSLFKKVGAKPVEVDTGFDYSQLIAGKVDAEWAFTVTAGLDLPAKGVAIRIISPADYGIVTDGYTIFASDGTVAQRPELVAKFLRASLDGVRDAVNSPQAATEALLRRDPHLDPQLSLKRQQLYNAVTSASAEYPPGYLDDTMFRDAYARLHDLGVLAKEFDVKDVYTLQFAGAPRPGG